MKTTERIDQRDYALDNVRAVLIFLVVFAHFLREIYQFGNNELLYKIIYSFHMPAIIFLFGYNVKFSPKRIAFRWAIPYFIFQSIYIVFAKFVLKEDVLFGYVTPYWILWYMMTCIFYQLLLPIYNQSKRHVQLLFIAASLAIAIVVGFVDSIGYEYSLSRFLVFQPWFLIGFYCKKNSIFESIMFKKKVVAVITIIAIMMIAISIIFLPNIKLSILYGAVSYNTTKSAAWMRLVSMFGAMGWIALIFVSLRPVLNRDLKIITKIGQNTLPIFLLHGFVVKIIATNWSLFLYYPHDAVLASVLIMLIFGNNICKNIVNYVSFGWIEKYIKAK